MNNFTLVPITQGKLDQYSQFSYTPIISTTDIKGSPTQIYGQAQNVDSTSISYQIQSLLSQVNNLNGQLAILQSLQANINIQISKSVNNAQV